MSLPLMGIITDIKLQISANKNPHFDNNEQRDELFLNNFTTREFNIVSGLGVWKCGAAC